MIESRPPEGWASVADLEKAYRQTLAELERSEAACASAMAAAEALTVELDRLRTAAQHVVDLFTHPNPMGLHAAIPALRQALNEGQTR